MLKISLYTKYYFACFMMQYDILFGKQKIAVLKFLIITAPNHKLKKIEK